ncbi:nucleotidyltransferase family protein [Flavobacteriaceae bacterium F89]|uniref:Nucleotidyltransferase family protein n=1 Tax=Cerina litoralis TaxID=2874477 RepID=A0AAE3EVE2_9FLAO|nr:nucleotidyltransferase family protein [Cerina litoralis]MCG2460357.1 nucleotidyltransferase family protein [Cerina litoralis]
MDTPKENIAILILAAGASMRMGRAKQLLPWGKTTLLEHSIAMAIGTNAEQITVVLGANANTIKLAVPMNGISHIVNPNWESGLGSSLACGMQLLTKWKSTHDGILIMLCDQPLMDTGFLNSLIEQFKGGQKGIVATRYGERAGVPAIFSTRYFSELATLHKDFGAKNLLDQNKSDVLSIDPQGKAIDVDTFEDYQKLARGHF